MFDIPINAIFFTRDIHQVYNLTGHLVLITSPYR